MPDAGISCCPREQAISIWLVYKFSIASLGVRDGIDVISIEVLTDVRVSVQTSSLDILRCGNSSEISVSQDRLEGVARSFSFSSSKTSLFQQTHSIFVV